MRRTQKSLLEWLFKEGAPRKVRKPPSRQPCPHPGATCCATLHGSDDWAAACPAGRGGAKTNPFAVRTIGCKPRTGLNLPPTRLWGQRRRAATALPEPVYTGLCQAGRDIHHTWPRGYHQGHRHSCSRSIACSILFSAQTTTSQLPRCRVHHGPLEQQARCCTSQLPSRRLSKSACAISPNSHFRGRNRVVLNKDDLQCRKYGNKW